MDISKYEEQYLKELKKASEKQLDPADFFDKSKSKKERISGIEETFGLRTEADVAKAAEILRDKAEPVEVRVSAINLISYKIGEQINLIELMFSIIKDASEPSELRRGALRALQQAGFTSTLLQSKRPEFLDTLRQVVDDPDPEIRVRVIEQLAKEKDEYVQRRLVEGLEDKKKALVPAETAIQFLGYDLHSEYFPLLKKIVADPPNQAAKNEAVRLLAADSDSKDILTEIVLDKTEKSELRQLGAVALQALAPEEFESHAKQIVMDDADYPEIKSVMIGGVAHFPEKGGVAEDDEFVKKVEDLQDSSSRKLKEIAKTFVSNQSDDKGEA
jgi:HEAT repeat protein